MTAPGADHPDTVFADELAAYAQHRVAEYAALKQRLVEIDEELRRAVRRAHALNPLLAELGIEQLDTGPAPLFSRRWHEWDRQRAAEQGQ